MLDYFDAYYLRLDGVSVDQTLPDCGFRACRLQTDFKINYTVNKGSIDLRPSRAFNQELKWVSVSMV